MICPECNTENLNHAKYCKKCGHVMPRDNQPSTSPISEKQSAPTANHGKSPGENVAPPVSHQENPNQILQINRPPSVYKKPLHYIWICDCSESMADNGKMDAVNDAVPKAIASIASEEEKIKKASISMNILKFSCHSEWMYKDIIPVKSFRWENLKCDGVSDLGEAFLHLAKMLKLQKDGGKMPEKAYPPVLVLISDGYPSDDWETGLNELNKEFWAKNAIRLAFGLEGADREVLARFVGNEPDRIIEIRDLSKLASEIKANTTVYKMRDRMPPGY